MALVVRVLRSRAWRSTDRVSEISCAASIPPPVISRIADSSAVIAKRRQRRGGAEGLGPVWLKARCDLLHDSLGGGVLGGRRVVRTERVERLRRMHVSEQPTMWVSQSV